jgi:hypothetical protein
MDQITFIKPLDFTSFTASFMDLAYLLPFLRILVAFLPFHPFLQNLEAYLPYQIQVAFLQIQEAILMNQFQN